MISSLKTTRFVVQLAPHQDCSTEKFDKTFADCVSFTCFIRLYSARRARETFVCAGAKKLSVFFVLGIYDEHAVFIEVEFDNLNFKRKAFINTLPTCQVEYFTIKRNSIWRQISLFDIACGNFAADEDLFM